MSWLPLCHDNQAVVRVQSHIFINKNYETGEEMTANFIVVTVIECVQKSIFSHPFFVLVVNVQFWLQIGEENVFHISSILNIYMSECPS